MLTELKREAYEANLALPAHGLVHLNFGNASALDRRRGIFAIKPSGVDYPELKVAAMVLVDLEGRVVEGKLRPSSDTPTHAELYRGFAKIAGIVHTHSIYATAFAQAGRPIPALGTTHADYFFGEVPVTRLLQKVGDRGLAYEIETGRVIRETFARKDPAETPGVLVNRHAPFAWGPTAAKAVENAVALELCARMALYTLQLEPGRSAIERPLLNRHFLRKHGDAAYYGQRPACKAEPSASGGRGAERSRRASRSSSSASRGRPVFTRTKARFSWTSALSGSSRAAARKRTSASGNLPRRPSRLPRLKWATAKSGSSRRASS